VQEQDDAVAASASLGESSTASLSAQEQDDSISSAAALTVDASVVLVEEGDTTSSFGTISLGASAAANEEGDSPSASATVALVANLAAPEEDDDAFALATTEIVEQPLPVAGPPVRPRRARVPFREAPRYERPLRLLLPDIMAVAQVLEENDGCTASATVSGLPTEVIRRRRIAAALLLAA
jgi:hypothetical protein